MIADLGSAAPTEHATRLPAPIEPSWRANLRVPKEQATTKHNRIYAFFMMFLLTILLGCAGSRTHEATAEYVDEYVVTTKVKAAMQNEPSLRSAEINLKTFKGVVKLSGFARSQADIDTAVEDVLQCSR